MLNPHRCCSQGNLPTRAASHSGLVPWGPAPACAHQEDIGDNPAGAPAPFHAHFQLRKFKAKGFSWDANGDVEKMQEERIAGSTDILGWFDPESVWNVQWPLSCSQPRQAEGCSFWGELVVHISLGETPCSEGWAFAEHLRPPEREPGLPSWASCTLRATQTPPSKWGVQRAGDWWPLPIKCRFHNLLPVPLGSINCVIFKGFDHH